MPRIGIGLRPPTARARLGDPNGPEQHANGNQEHDVIRTSWVHTRFPTAEDFRPQTFL
jgi:hypothetical protein